jgi:hypothetical protein
MANRCPDCGVDLDKFGARHRCLGGKAQGQRQLTKLEAEKIARGEMSPADLVPKDKPAPSQPAGRLAKRPADTRPAPVRQPQPSLADVMKELAELKAMLLELKPSRE